MKISLRDAESQLSDLFRRARAGDEVVLTEGQNAVRLVPEPAATVMPTVEQKRALLAKIIAEAGKAAPGPDAARSQDFLYNDEDGMPK